MPEYRKVSESAEADLDEEEGARAGTSENTALVSSSDATSPQLGSKKMMFLRLTILVAVTLQNTGYALIRRYSRGHLKEHYSTSSVLLAMEIAKLALSIQQVACGRHESDVPDGTLFSKCCFLVTHSWKMLVPAVIYLVMNILGFVALGHLDASTFSIVAQMKVCTPATANADLGP